MSVTGDLNSLYKVAYAKGVEDLLPWKRKIADMVSFVPSELQNGKHYEQPVILTGEQGFTYSLDTQDAYDLNDSIGMAMQSAIVPGADIVLNSTVGYNQAARASHSATSFKSVMSTKFDNMLKSSSHRLEIGFLYGCLGIADLAIGTFDETAPGATTAVMTIAASDWATGIWTGAKNAELAFYSDSSTTIGGGTNLNANATSDKVVVSAVDVENKQITVTSTAAAIEDINDVSATKALRVYFYGAVSGTGASFAHAEMAGLKKIITNTGSLFGIDAAVYDLWKGNSLAITGQLTMAKVLSGLAKPIAKGLEDDVVLMVNPLTWADLASNLAALRRFDGSYSKSKAANGSKALEYESQNGTVKIISYNIVKEGDAVIFPPTKAIRVGAWDLSLNDPTRTDKEEIFFTIPGKAGVGLRAYTNQAIFIEAPSQCLYISGIVNSNAA